MISNSLDWQHLPKISVITPSFNQGEYIRETLISVLSQDYPNLEYIVIDGGSTDDSVNIIKNYESQLAYWVSEPDNGQSHAINKGFARANGDIFCWLNSDDQFAPDALWSVALAFIQSKADLVAGICEVYEEGQLIHRHLTSCSDGPLPLDTLMDLDNGWNAGQFFYQPEVFFSRELWLKAGAQVREDYYYSMDYELWCRFALNQANLHVIGTPLVHFRSHEQQKTADESKFKEELVKVRDSFLIQYQIDWHGSSRPQVDWSKRMRVAMVNDLSYQYGAGVAHMRVAGAFDLAGQDVAAFDLLSSDADNDQYLDIVERIRAFNPDCVVFGNLHGVEKRSIAFLEELETHYPCFWLTHDFWLITGRCPYMGDCHQYLSGCDVNCPTADEYPVIPKSEILTSWRAKRNFLQQARQFSFWANSRWSKKRVDSALDAFPNNINSQNISLGVPTDIFQPQDKRAAKQQFNIDERSFTIAFSVSSLSDERKGGQMLIDALGRLPNADITLILIGRLDKPVTLPGIKLVKLGYVEDVKLLVSALNAADIYVGPSAEETFGQVFVEAALCGTPSVGFDTSGIQDAIVNNITGVKVKERTVRALADTLIEFMHNRALLARIAFTAPLYAKGHFSIEASYRTLFNALDQQGLIDQWGMPHKISFSRTSDLIRFSTKGWVELSLPRRMNAGLRRLVDKLIGACPNHFTSRIRQTLPRPLEKIVMRWLSGRKY